MGNLKKNHITIIIIGILFTGALLIYTVNHSDTSKEIESCKDISNNTEKTLCEDRFLWSKAINDSDIKICKEISKENFQENCKRVVALESAAKENNESICNILEGDYKITCIDNVYFNQAIGNLETAICEKITFNPLVDTCKKNVQDILKNKDAEFCNMISNLELKNTCKEKISQ